MNYLVKWNARAVEEDAACIVPIGDGAAAITTESEMIRRTTQTKQTVNTLEEHKDSVIGVAGVPTASSSAII